VDILSALIFRMRLWSKLSDQTDYNAPSALCARQRLLLVMCFPRCRSEFFRGPRYSQRRIKCVASPLGRTGVGAHISKAPRGCLSMFSAVYEHVISTGDRRLCTSLCGLKETPSSTDSLFQWIDICSTVTVGYGINEPRVS